MSLFSFLVVFFPNQTPITIFPVNVDLSEWDIADLRVLVASVEREAPTNETCRFRTSLDKVDWTAVAAGMGGGRSGEECKRALNTIIQQVRGESFKTLLFLFTNVLYFIIVHFRSAPIAPCRRFSLTPK